MVNVIRFPKIPPVWPVSFFGLGGLAEGVTLPLLRRVIGRYGEVREGVWTGPLGRKGKLGVIEYDLGTAEWAVSFREDEQIKRGAGLVSLLAGFFSKHEDQVVRAILEAVGAGDFTLNEASTIESIRIWREQETGLWGVEGPGRDDIENGLSEEGLVACVRQAMRRLPGEV